MIRFILKRETRDKVSGYRGESFETLDVNVPELQERLSKGGRGENGFDYTTLVGAEVVQHDQKG